MMNKGALWLSLAIAVTASTRLFAHEGAHEIELGSIKSTVLNEKAEDNIKQKVRTSEAGTQTSGTGFWRFEPVEIGELPEAVTKNIRGAHGTIVVDKKRDAIYWGLQNVGWVALSNNFKNITVIPGAPKFTSGNLHGAEILERGGSKSLIAAADDVEGEIYLSDTDFNDVETLGWPEHAPYTAAKEFHPTDVTFTKKNELLVTDGYGKAFFAPVETDPLRYKGQLFGGKKLSNTPHGVTTHGKKIFIAARPEAGIIIWDPKTETAEEVLQLPAGSTVCDVDIWGDYALAPCLNGPNNTPGPIYIVNLKTKTIASVIHPKQELGFDQAQHIHDAAWYVRGRGKEREVFVVFTNWNPGGIGVLKLVGAPKLTAQQ